MLGRFVVAIGGIAAIGETEHERSPIEWAFFALGLLATVVVTVYITRLARAALNKQIED